MNNFLIFSSLKSDYTFLVKKAFAFTFLFCFSQMVIGQTYYIGPWDPIANPPVTGTPGWEIQDDNVTGLTPNDPFASWSQFVNIINDTPATNITANLFSDAYIESFDYDNDATADNGILGHNLGVGLVLTSSANGLNVLGTSDGCQTLLDNTANGSGNLFASLTGMDGVTFKNLYFLNGFAGVFSLVNTTNVLIENCVFDNNDLGSVPVFRIESNNGTPMNITLKNCTFINNNNNTAKMDILRGASGSLITIDFEDCVWACNSTSGTAGTAILLSNSSSSPATDLSFTGCTFANNTSGGSQGGAIYFENSSSTAVFTNTNFIQNSAAGGNGGGAIFIGTDDQVTLTGCTFFENTLLNSSADGAAINAISGSSGQAVLNITNCTFDGNDAIDDGGAINLRYASATLNNVHIVNNDAGDGIITLGNSSAILDITNYTCSGNTGPDGCIYNRGPGTLIDNGGSATGSPIDLSGLAPDYACATFCATEIPSPCLATTRSNNICAAPGVIDISGQIWTDVDGDGVQEAEDGIVPNAYVILYDDNDALIGRAYTDGSGNYSFTDLPAGNYYVVFVNSVSLLFPNVSPANAGAATEATDSDITNTSTNATDLINTTTSDVDAAFTNVVLPVELLSFIGFQKGKSIQLQWKTSMEVDNAGFYLERSSDTKNWEHLTFLEGKGNTNSGQEYAYLDEKPLAGKNYYRLKQVDFSGQFEYFNIVFVNMERANQIVSIYPNPAKDDLNINIEIENATDLNIRVLDYSGKEVKFLTKSISNNQNNLSMDISDLNNGIYFLQFTSTNQLSEIIKFVKE